MPLHRRSFRKATLFVFAGTIVIFLCAHSLSAQWTTTSNGDAVNNNSSGKVGIGISATYPAPDFFSLRNTTNGGAVNVSLDGWTNGERGLVLRSNTGTSPSVRWKIGSPYTTGGEPGGNAGTDFAIERFNDSGTSQGYPFFIQRGSGNVGIGTTSPSYALTVNSDVAANFTALALTSNDIGTPGRIIEQRWGYKGYNYQKGAFYFESKDANGRGKFHFALNNAADSTNVSTNDIRMTIDSNGNFGIGTTSPSQPLHVEAATAIAYLKSTTGANRSFLTAQNGAGSFYAGVDNSSGNGILNGSVSYAGVVGTASNTPLVLGANNNAYAIIDTSGKVGIGLTNPVDRLVVRGFNGNAAIEIGNNTFNGGYFANSLASYDRVASAYKDLRLISDSSNNTLVLQAGGNVGIGTPSPTSKLQVSGGDVGIDGNQTIWLSASKDTGISENPSSGVINFAVAGNGTTRGFNFLYGSNSRFSIDAATGNVSISGPTGQGNGNLTVSGNISAKYQDVAEWVRSSEQLSAGTVVVLDSTKSNQVTSSSIAYDTRVAGVVSQQPGIALGEKSEGKVLVATTGRVRVKVDASKAPIHIGDLLVTSDVPGLAMKSEPVNLGGAQIHRPGTLIGKAQEPLEKGKGTILVLLSLQ